MLWGYIIQGAWRGNVDGALMVTHGDLWLENHFIMTLLTKMDIDPSDSYWFEQNNMSIFWQSVTSLSFQFSLLSFSELFALEMKKNKNI